MGWFKKNQNYILGALLVAVAIGAIGYGPNGLWFNPGAISTGSAATDAAPAPGASGATKVIQYAGTVTETFSLEDKYTGSAVDAEGIAYRGNDRIYDSSAVNSTTATLNKGETVLFMAYDDGHSLMVNGSATALDGSADWYMIKKNIPVTMDQDQDSVTYKMVKEGTATMSVINSDGATLNASGAQENLSAGDQKTLTIKLTGPAEAAFGAPDSTRGIGILLDANKGLYESLTISGATAVPGYQCDSSPTYTTNNLWEYELNQKSLENSGEITIKLVAKVKSGIAPVDGTADINYSIADPAGFYYEDADVSASLDEKFPYDVCDRTDLVDVGNTDVTGTIYVN